LNDFSRKSLASLEVAAPQDTTRQAKLCFQRHPLVATLDRLSVQNLVDAPRILKARELAQGKGTTKHCLQANIDILTGSIVNQCENIDRWRKMPVIVELVAIRH